MELFLQVHNISIAALVWVWSRHDTKPSYYPVCVILAGISCYRNLLVNALLATFIDPWTVLIIKALVTSLIGGSTIRVYSTVA